MTVAPNLTNAQISVSTSSTPSSCQICNGTATVNASGGTFPYTYFWTPSGQTTQTVTGLCGGTYTIVVTDAIGASATTIVTVSQTSAPIASISGSTSITSGNSTTLTASGGVTYSWYPSTGLNSVTGSTVIASPTSTTTYCVIATDGNFCSDTSCVTIYVIPTGIQDFYNNKSLSIFPNPFSIQTTLQTDNLLHNATLTVYNSQGQQVKQFVIRNSDSFVIRRDNLPSGLYFIRLIEENKTIAVDKLAITDK